MRIATGLTRKVGMLHKMVDAAANGDLKYSKVIAYIESQCLEEEVVSDDDGDEDDVTNQGDDMSSTWPTPKNSNRKLDGSRGSALSSVSPPTDKKPRTKTVPNEELRKELWYDSQGHSLLRKAVLKSAPHKLLLKLCNLCPEAAQVEDSKGRLVLHHACRLPVNEQTETILLLLLQTHVLGVIHRDAGGRTPLHYLFWYHASNRSVEVVTAFCGRIRKTKFYALRQQHDPTNKDGSNLPPLPEIPTPNASHSVPNTAAIIPDAQHGCLPLHYAVMEGATVDALQVLLQAYPLSKHAVDRYGQTPLHWYLGGHYLCQGTHVSGCDRDPNARPWHATPIDPNVVRLLSSSRVARTGDSQGRTPLHWAACYWAHAYHFQALSDEEEPAEFPLTVATAKVIVDQHIGALGQRDHQQQSPLMVLFQTTFSLQSGYKGPLLPLRFSPPLACVQILLEGTLLTDASSGADENRQAQPKNKVVELSRGKRRGCITTLEDASGDLPLHVALATAAPVEIVQAILAGHDGALLHGNDSNRVPLHCAFAFPHSAQLQHTEVISLLLSKTPGMLDGRLALKIEDSTGQYPIHLACQNNASIDILQVVVKAYPKTALLQNQNGCLPVHTVVSPHILVSALSLGKAASERAGFDGAESADDARVIEMRQERQRLFVAQARQKKLHEIQETREKILILIEPILLSDKAGTHLTLANEAGYLPLHFVVLFGAAYETLYRLLRACPVSALQLTNDGKSVLDLHEQKLFQKDWNEIRQLLFSFAPTLESHRHRVELLKQCVQIVVQEVSATSVHCEDNASSFHWTVEQKLKELENDLENAPELQLSQTLSTNIDAVKLSFSNSQHSEHHAMVKAASKASRLSTAKIAAAKNKQSDKSLKARRKSVQPSRGPKSFELSASLSDNAPTPSSPRAQAQSKYDEGDTRLNYVISDTEYDEDDSYFSDDDEEEEYLSDEEHTESEYDTTNRDSTMHSVPTNTFSSDFEASTSQGFHVMSSHSTLEEIFMTAKLKAMKNESEEKKDEYEARSREDHASLGIDTTTSSRSLMAPACDSDDSMLAFAVRPEWFSEVGLRIWAFFALYRDKHNPSDNYSSQVTSIFNEIEYDCVESLVMLPLPSCARMYFPETPSKDLKRLIFREAANPKCREFMHRMCFFIGTYEFQSDYGPDIVAYQSEDGNSVVVKAYEWLFTTEESTDAVTPGVSEATIWKTGEVPAEVGLAFRSVRRPVRIQFTKRQDVYDKEVRNRIRAGVPVECRGFEAVNNMVPLLNHYNANDSSRRENRMYLTDVQDGRFSTLQLCRGSTVGVYDSISLAEYPFALVYPDICSESLESLHSRCGVGESKQRKEICFAIADAVLHLHSRDIVHANLSMSCASLSKNAHSESRSWILSGLNYSACTMDSPSNMAACVTPQGYGQFVSGTLPPELFTRLSPADSDLYEQYWVTVETQFGIRVDKKAVDPVVDIATGQAYVVKCHFMPLSHMAGIERNDTPRLPYELVPISTSLDLWAFGLILFQLYAGRPLFPTDGRTGHLLDYHDIFEWSIERARDCVYEFVADSIAQDLILRLLAPYEDRQKESMEGIMKHPFFTAVGDASTSATVTSMIAHHQMEAAAYKRRRQSKQMEVSETSLLEERTVKFSCWDFTLLERFYLSPTETMTRLMPPQPWRKDGTLLPFPCALLVLPYRLDYAPIVDEHCGVSFGKEYLEWCKAVFFCTQFKRRVESLTKPNDSRPKLSVEGIFKRLGMTEQDFGSIKNVLAELASKHVFQFRENPSTIVLKMVELSLQRLLSNFDIAGAFVYLVDEHKVVAAVSDNVYPIAVPDARKQDAVKNSLALMHMCTQYGRGRAAGLLGLYKLLVDPTAQSESDVPSSWSDSAAGLPHGLDEALVRDEIHAIQDVLSGMNSCKFRVGTDDVEFWRDYLYQADPKRTFCDLVRVSASGLCLWTSRDGSIELGEAARAVSFRDALRLRQPSDSP